MELFELAAQKLKYRKSDGALLWVNAGRRADLNGKVAGAVSTTDGYRYIKVSQVRVPAHRIVFLHSPRMCP